MNKDRERYIKASVGTLLFLLLLFLLLWFVTMQAVVPEEQAGIEVSFGQTDEAGGYMTQQSEVVPIPSQSAQPVRPNAPSDNNLLTQEDEESLVLRREQDEAEKARRQAEAERLRRQREEQARLEAEQREREAAAEAERAKQQEAIAKANALGSLFGTNGSDAVGSGDSQGTGQKGNPVGHGSEGGIDWSLAGRGIHGTLPKPSNTFNQEGKVIVEIRVNAAGNVVYATHKGGNVSDKQTIQLALEAARKAKFTEGEHDQIGTITYNFKFN